MSSEDQGPFVLRKRTEEALQESENRLRALLNAIPDMMFRISRDGVYLDFIPAKGLKPYIPPSEFLGKRLQDVLPPDIAAQGMQSIHRTIESGQPNFIEYQLIMDGAPHDFEGRIVVSGKDEVLFIARDITERKRMLEALQESERRFRKLAHEQERQLILSERLISFGQLTASIAHEFNNPLGIVIGFAQDLLTEVDPADSRYQSVKIIEEEARRCKKIMQDLLDFGRQTPPQFTPMEPAEIIRKSIDLFTARFQKARVHPKIQDTDGLPKIWVDPHQMDQVLVNLFFNAIEAMPDGGTLTIGMTVQPGSPVEGLREGPAGKDEVVIAVTDTGYGIDSDKLHKIFDPFFTTKTKKGMGLGLSVCKSIMRAHGGEISAKSIPGQGTTFYLHLPVERRRSIRNESVTSR